MQGSPELHLGKEMRTVGLWEYVLIRRATGGKWTRFKAKIDSGARWSRIGVKEAAQLKLGPIIDSRKIRTGTGHEVRAVVPARICIGGYRIVVRLTVSTRRNGVLIGRRTLGKRFKIIPSRKLGDKR